MMPPEVSRRVDTLRPKPVRVLWYSKSRHDRWSSWQTTRRRGIPHHWRLQHTQNYWVYVEEQTCEWWGCVLCFPDAPVRSVPTQ